MNVGILSVGTEVATGTIVDTNAAWVAQRLTEIGVHVRFQVAVDDHELRIVDALRWLVERSDAIVTGGGIGPTPDDRTRAAVAEVAGVRLERRPELEEAVAARFAEYGVDMADVNRRQADVPEGATSLPPIGTAPGFHADISRSDGGTCRVYVLPGVPFELREMAERDVIPDLVARGGRSAIVTRTVHVTGAGESSVAEILEPVTERTADADDVEVSFLASSDEVLVRVTAEAGTPDEAGRRAGTVLQEVVERLGRLAAGVDDDRLEETVARLLRGGGLTVATGESCTGGLVASRLSSVTGATDYLRGGLVAYATDVKSGVLGVDEATLAGHGPCSSETAEEMAARAREVFAADLGIGVVCVAGPSEQDGKDVGTTIWALATGDGTRSWSRLIPGDRPTVTSRAATAALEALRRHLLAELPDFSDRGASP